MTPEDAAALTEANFAYRKRLHALALAERPALVGEREFEPGRARVGRFGGAFWNNSERSERRARVRANSFIDCPIPQGRAHIGIDEKRLAPIGVDGEEIGATRHMGATVIRHGGIIPP